MLRNFFRTSEEVQTDWAESASRVMTGRWLNSQAISGDRDHGGPPPFRPAGLFLVQDSWRLVEVGFPLTI
jgi:hypothetical protein